MPLARKPRQAYCGKWVRKKGGLHGLFNRPERKGWGSWLKEMGGERACPELHHPRVLETHRLILFRSQKYIILKWKCTHESDLAAGDVTFVILFLALLYQLHV